MDADPESRMKLLLVEDEKGMMDALNALLTMEGYDIDQAMNGPDAFQLILAGIYDVIVLDVMLPGMSGFEVVKKMREVGVQTPVLMLTAKTSMEDMVCGLDSGADDYLTKPFETPILLARLRALCRRGMATADGSLTYGDLKLDQQTATLTCTATGQTVRLSEKEMKILEYLIANQGKILTRDQIALRVWGVENDAEYNNVEVYLSFTRRKMAFIGSTTQIKALRGIGYELRKQDV